MRLYRTYDGQWAGTQADAKKLGKFEQIEVPTDKAGLLDFLNGNKDVGTTLQVDGDKIPAEVVKSGSTMISPLAYIKNNVGVSEIQNLYSSFTDAYNSIQFIMSVLGNTPTKGTGLMTDEAKEHFESVNDKHLLSNQLIQKSLESGATYTKAQNDLENI